MEFLHEWLDGQRTAGNYRRLPAIRRLPGGRLILADQPGLGPLVDFSSNDYLALSEHPALIAASREALENFGTGSGAARLMSGNLAIHEELEAATARLKGKEAALVFGSGFMANVGVIPAIAEHGDVILADRLCHASIFDGCRLAGARLCRFRHNDLGHLEELLKKHHERRRALVVVESVYSMDGDFAPLADLVELKKRHDFILMVDEAHGTGIYGENGGGLAEETGVAAAIDIAMGTYGKALGSYGAFVAGERPLIDFLVNRARSFLFSTALPPAVAAASLAAVNLTMADPSPRRLLRERAAFFRNLLAAGGIEVGSASQIVPIVVGESDAALALASKLKEEGIFATAVRPPTVPAGSARVRLSVTNHHSTECLRETAAILLRKLVRQE